MILENNLQEISGFYGDDGSHSNLLICDTSSLRIQAGGSTEVLVKIYQTTRHHIADEVMLQ
jgi:hypothetical protein